MKTMTDNVNQSTVPGCFYRGSRNLTTCKGKPHWEVTESGKPGATFACTSHVGAALTHGHDYTVRAITKRPTGA